MVARTCGTPGVLERSGVGESGVLHHAGVPVVADVPGVGADFQDHQLIVYPYKTGLAKDESLDDVATGRVDATKLIENKHRIVGWNGIDTSLKIRPNSDSEIEALGPQFKTVWDRDFKDAPNRPLMLTIIIAG